MKTIGVVTVSRADYSIALPILRRIQADPALTLHLIVAGMHLVSEFGRTVGQIMEDGFAIGDRVDCLLASDSPEGIAKSIGLGVIGFAQAYARVRPDLLLVVGDRFEMHAAAVAATPWTIPIAHIHGGELTEGAFDNAFRHSMTTLSHLHFVTMPGYAQRLIQMGEEPWRVVVSGAPSLDNLRALTLLERKELAARYGLRLEAPPLLVTLHSVTLEYEQAERQAHELLEALRACDMPLVFTMPNADTNGRTIRRMIEAFVNDHPTAQVVENLGTQGYFSMMACAAAMVGNSSSGIVEAPSFGLPVVNIGTRQQGRLRAKNVIDVGYQREEILQGIRRALMPDFRAQLRGQPNPYGNGEASEIIVRRLKEVQLDQRLIHKRFVEMTVPTSDATPAEVGR